jgi:hypothetical protein
VDDIRRLKRLIRITRKASELVPKLASCHTTINVALGANTLSSDCVLVPLAVFLEAENVIRRLAGQSESKEP